MHDLDFEPIIQELMTIFNKCAPTGQNQRALVNYVHAAREDGCTNKQIAKYVAMALVDGLRSDNWLT